MPARLPTLFDGALDDDAAREEKRRAKHSLREKRKREKNPWAFWSRQLKRTYGIDGIEYEAMVAAQGGVCAICGGVTPCGRRLSVDHCHDTGRIRGLLCEACNSGIGKLRDDPVLLRRAIDYLEFWEKFIPEWQPPRAHGAMRIVERKKEAGSESTL